MLASQSHPSSFTAGTEGSTVVASPAPLRGEEVDSARLLHGQREVLIRHGSEVYRLRHTRNDKLILTK